MADAAFTIGRLSAETGVSIETIRYYERIGLMPRPLRSGAGRRLYGALARNRLGFVRRARELGFSIAEIRTLLSLSEAEECCADVHALTLQHLSGVREKIADLKKLERTLARTVGRCAEGASPHCPIIEALSRSPS